MPNKLPFQLPKSVAFLVSRTALCTSVALCTLAGLADVATADDARVQPLPFGQQVVRFAGEIAQASYQVYLAPSSLTQPIAFQLAPTSAISVMLEASWMHVEVNGTALSPIRLGTDRSTTALQRPIGPQMLQAGWNTVNLSVDQRHRVDCSYPATFELWTDLSAASTGFVVTGSSGAPLSLADLPAMALDANGRLPMHGVLPAGADQARAQAISDALALLALALDADAPVVSVGQDAKPGAINVRLDDAGAVALGTYSLARDAAGDGTGFIITLGGATPSHWNDAATDLAQALRTYTADKPGAGHLTLDGSYRFTLADLGLPSQEFSGRHFEQRFSLSLPTDFLPADVGRAEIRLAGGYAEGLSDQAELSVQVNGALAASIPLDARRGEVFSDRAVYIDLGHFRPGHNEVAILADVTHQDDASCDVATLTSAEPRFLLLDETSISFPKFARLGQLPRLAPGLAQDILGARSQTHIYVPHPDIESISAATALRVQLALDLETASGVSLRFDTPHDEAGQGHNAIVVAALGDLSTTLTSQAELDGRDLLQGSLQDLLQDIELAWIAPDALPVIPGVDPIMTASIPGNAPRTVLPVAQPLPQSLGVVVQSAPAAWSSNPVEQRLAVLRQERSAPSTLTTASIGANTVALRDRPQALPPRPTSRTDDADMLRQRWEQTVSDQPQFMRSAGEFGQRLQVYLVDLVRTRQHVPEISMDADLVIQQMASSAWSDSPLTLITASEPARLEAAMQAVTQPQHWQALDGSRAVFSQTSGLDVSMGLADTHYVITQPASISNWRLVLAGYYSNNPILYTLAILLIAPGLGIVCGRAIGRSGQVEGQGEQEAAHA